MNDLENKIDYVDQIYACNEPLSWAGSFVIPTGLLAQSSLGDDGPLSTGGFLCAVISSAWLPPARLPFLPGSRFPSNIIAIKRQEDSSTNNNTLAPTDAYRNPPSIFKYISTYGSFILLPPRCRLHMACCLLAVRPWPIPGGFQVRRSAYPLAVVGGITQLQKRRSAVKLSQQPDSSHEPATQRQDPNFSGDILEFKAFWRQLEGAVHRRKDFDDVTKLIHLRSCLSGEALQLLSGLTITAENYEALVRLLHDRFHQTTDTLDAHIS
ncbi:hypothetical protein T12_15781 [Trichinella patagoniensis]|uniref:Uncharacterized protein n=1 Tax=Trichinella patagoniensis TaxID=990121 RepID=A0A0V1AHJ7_9BILA|nr:hypothetical protein T12_15781 [Trichinella patagoniensis]